MNPISSDHLDRAEKMALDTGEAIDPEEAHRIFEGYRLQLLVGRDAVESEAMQVGLLTAVNAGARAFKGGVDVRIEGADSPCLVPWAADRPLSEAVTSFGGTVVPSPNDEIPTLIFGDATELPQAQVLLFVGSEGWAGYVSPDAPVQSRNAKRMSLSATLGAALGVSECFQHVRGDIVCGQREVGLSLWRPDLDWNDPEAAGEVLTILPAEWWLIGLGHLGQAYAWVIGTLPYRDRAAVSFMLQDTDRIVQANLATSLLANPNDLGKYKARHVASALERIGFSTHVSERLLDGHQRVGVGEPRLALAGLDNVAGRRHLMAPDYHLAVDAGLGGGPRDYTDMVVHSFPATVKPSDVFADDRADGRRGERLVDNVRAYQVQEQAGSNRCGLVEVAGRAVATAFVGTAAACLVVAEALRATLNGPGYELIDLSLRAPQRRECIRHETPRDARWSWLPSTAL